MKPTPHELARLRTVLRDLAALAPVVDALLENAVPLARRRRVAPPVESVTELERAHARAELQRVRAARSQRR